MNGDSPGKHRLFFALPVKLESNGVLADFMEKLGHFRRELKIVPQDNYHITLKFLGSVTDATCRELSNSLQVAQLPEGAIPFRLTGTGAFPGMNRPAVFWIGFDIDSDRVGALFRAIESLAALHGFDPEGRDFVPHLTVARVRDRKRPSRELIDLLQRHSEFLFGASCFDRVVLYESTLLPSGPLYRELATRTLE